MSPKITALPTLAALTDGDLIPVVDGETGTTEHLDVANLLSNPRWDDIRVSMTRAQPNAGAPTFNTFKGNVKAWAFTGDDAMSFDLQIPHDARVGVAGAVLHPHLHWSPGNNTNTGTVRWELDVEVANNGANFATLSGSPLLGPQAGAGVAYRHQIIGFGSIDASAMQASTLLLCTLRRNSSGDSYSGLPFALSVDFHYQRNRGGTVAEFGA